MKIATFSLLLASAALGIAQGNSKQESPMLRALEQIRSISAEGSGNAEAAAAWKLLAAQPASDIPVILNGMNEVHPVAKNYLYAAARALADQPNAMLPTQAMESFLLNNKHDATARKLCYDLLLRRDASVKERLVPKLLKDPCATLRREAVARLVVLGELAAKADQKDQAVAHYQEALKGAIEEEQVKSIADELKKLGKEVDLLKHFGFVTDWLVMGPFHNTARAGFAEKFPVEPPAQVKTDAVHRGKDGPVNWKPIKVTDPMGLVLFNKELAEKKEVTAYAVTNFITKANQQAQIRLGSKNAWKVWLNGELIFERDEYHRGRRIDQYVLPVTLREGSNQVMVKCCQNEEIQTWTGEWQFQLRITDMNGDYLTSQSVPAPVAPTK